LLAGAGVAVLYPLGVSAALASVPGEPARAGMRLTMANGFAVLVAPFMLGAIADVAGVATGWTTILGLVAASSVLAFGLGRRGGGPVPSTKSDRGAVHFDCRRLVTWISEESVDGREWTVGDG
jgi:MFS family permease